MKSNKIAFYVLLASVALFSTGCTLKKITTTDSVDKQNVQEGAVKNEPVSKGPTSLSNLLALNKPQKCTWEQTIDGKNISATIYVNGKSFKQELPMGSLGTFYGYSDGITFYSWSDATPNGVKMNMVDISKSADELKTGDATSSTNVDLNKDYNFKCSNWVVDPSVFVVPSNIQFVDLADFTKGIKDVLKNVDVDKLKNLGGSN